MATEYPPLGKSYVISYSNNDRDYPIIGIRKDPRVDNYKIPADLSPHPDATRYPNHVFTGANPTNSDERVLWVYEILPSPWVPFTRYDDDLGPVQGRRRSVKNQGQTASLASDKRTTYEAREGSAIVYTELEETWSIKTDDDENSLFPIRIRDFYDASRGAVEERRQLFVPTGEEVATLENVNGIITETSYEPYNEFLSFKIVRTYAVDGPQLIGKTTNNDGQLVTVTTQRKASDNYVAPQPTATKTVEVTREDAESLVERIVDTPEVFSAKTLSRERPDPIPQKFRVLIPTDTEQESVEGTASLPTLDSGELSKTEQQQTKFVKRISTTTRDQTELPQSLTQKTTDNDGQVATITETLQFGDTEESPTATKIVRSEALGDGNYVVTKTEVPEIFSAKTLSKEKPDPVPQKFRVLLPSLTEQEIVAGNAKEPSLADNEFSKSEQQISKFTKRISTTSRDAVEDKTLSGVQSGTWGQESTQETYTSDPNITTQFGVKTVRKTPLGDGKYIEEVENYPSDSDNDGIIYTLSGQKQDEVTKAVIKIEKSLVEAGTVFSGRVANYIENLRSDGNVVEVQSIDKWHSITIASKIISPPNNQSWIETGRIDLPSRLLEVGVIWNSNYTPAGGTSGVGSTTLIKENNLNWSVRAESSITGEVLGSLYTKTRNGYSGAAQFQVVRTFHEIAPTDEIAIHKFEPVYGTVSIRSQSATNTATSNSNGVGDIYIASGGSQRFNNDYGLSISQFGPIEHNDITLTETGDPKTITQSISSSSGSTPAGPYPVATVSISIAGIANLELPESSIPLESGNTYVVNVDVKPWRLGWWVREVYTATVP